MRMTANTMEYPSPTLECRLLRCYQGEPSWPDGEFQSENVVIWHLLKGSVLVRQKGIEIHAQGGSGLFITPGLRVHSFSSDAQILSAMLHIKAGGAMWSGPPVVVFSSSPDFLKAFRSLLTQRISAAPLDQIDSQHALWKFLSTLSPVLTLNGMTFALSEAADNRVEQSRRFLDALPLDQPWNRLDVAASAGVSASQLDRLWRESLEQTPHHYWELRRRRFACEQLENSTRPIKEIALDLGFVHFSQFSNWFRKSLGWTPSHHRLTRPS